LLGGCNSGKTYTLVGNWEQEEEKKMGIII
jgi:hypothetical protein